MVLDCARFNLQPLPSFYSDEFRNNYCQDASHSLVVPPEFAAPERNYSGFTVSRCMPSESVLLRESDQEVNFSPAALRSLSQAFGGDVSAFSLKGRANVGNICLNRPYFVGNDRSVADLNRARQLKDYFQSATCEAEIGHRECVALDHGLRDLLRGTNSFRELYPEETPWLDGSWGTLLKFLGVATGFAVIAKIVDSHWPWNGPRGGNGVSIPTHVTPVNPPTAPAQRMIAPEFSSILSSNTAGGMLIAAAAATLGTALIRCALPPLLRGGAMLVLRRAI